MRRSERWRDERGSVAVELVIVAPLFGLLLLAVVAVGRVQNAHADVDAAARMAARDLSITRDPHLRLGPVEQAVAATLQVGSPSCRTMTFDAVIGGEQIDVTVGCTAELQQAALLPVPGSLTVTGSASEVRDIYREVPS
jgi:Flp pilus assembly protein TadG